MADSIKISKLTKINDTDLSDKDQLVINDADRSDGQIITRRTNLIGITSYFTAQKLTFSEEVSFTNVVAFNDNVTFQVFSPFTGMDTWP